MKSIRILFGLMLIIFSTFSCTPEDLPDSANPDLKISANKGEEKRKLVEREID